MPSTAANQFEMFQAAHFDNETLSRELGFAGDLGFNIVRVFLHDLLWEAEGDSFLDRVDQFLGMADANGIASMLVLFDGCWDPMPQTGAQPAPRPHVHNSRWAQSPGKAALQNLSQHDVGTEDRLKAYVQAVLTRFKDDARVALWDVFNEPDNGNADSYGWSSDRVPSAEDAKGTELHPMDKAVGARALLSLAFGWAREVGPSQPLTAAIYTADTGDADADAYRAETHQWMLNTSDVISFHNYDTPSGMAAQASQLQALGRPVVCSEYMARPVNCTFDPILGNLKDLNVWAVNWGFVNGLAQTIYPWDSWQVEYAAEPPLWFHDVLHGNGTPYIQAEMDYIRNLTRGSAAEVHLV